MFIDLADLLERVPQKRILAIGDLMLDQYWWGIADRISPEAPVPVVRKTRTSSTPGGAANSASNAAALGARVAAIGVIGQDTAGQDLTTALAARGIDCSGIVVAAGRP